MAENNSPIILVIFGATGDLARTKLLPSIYKLLNRGRLPPNFYIVGFSRRDLSTRKYRQIIKEELQKQFQKNIFSQNLWQKLSSKISYLNGDFDDPKSFRRLNDYLSKISRNANRILYLATPPSLYEAIIDNFQGSGLSTVRKNAWRRVLIEKPFGRDLTSAKILDEKLLAIFNEKEIYRVDHYLGKETVQNILVFRFANSVFETDWNKDFIDHVQITAGETEGVGTRGGFYEQTGTLRDMVQNHLLNLVALMTMEQPRSLKTEDLARERHKLLSSLICYEPSQVEKYVVRGQYGPAKQMVSYRQEEDIAPSSNVETFVALKLFIGNKRWQGVPFYLRTGKRLAKKITEISLHLKSTCKILFGEKCGNEQNILSLRIQPEEGITLRLIVKKPGFGLELRGAPMEFSYRRAFKEELIDSYERVFVDVLKGDRTLFSRSDGIEASWQFIDNILYTWKTQKPPKFPNYETGSWGPKEAEELIARDGRSWFVR